ncbi:MAG: PhnD/SsuA/transferrin family substrate-binding protein [Hyphomicrobiales bacterium]|nr:PhnD/SsuA/transferrin family substrate-binding protein [Hyphomicrobiales bacterium]
MHDGPGQRAANDKLWIFIANRLRAAGIAAPAALTREVEPAALGRSPDLLFAQTCGFPLMAQAKDRPAILATPHYAAAGCAGPSYRSLLVCRAGNDKPSLIYFRGRRLALNAPDSHSGMNALRFRLARIAGGTPFFGEVVMTGSHVASLEAVAGGRADMTSVDCVTFANARESWPDVAGRLTVFDLTEPAPGLPFITAAATPAPVRDALQAALDDAMAAPELDDARKALKIVGLSRLTEADYSVIPARATIARELGYPELR